MSVLEGGYNTTLGCNSPLAQSIKSHVYELSSPVTEKWSDARIGELRLQNAEAILYSMIEESKAENEYTSRLRKRQKTGEGDDDHI